MRLIVAVALAALFHGSLMAAETRTVNHDDAIRFVRGQKVAAQCGSKRKCSQMNSCKEACFYLLKCGLSRLDRDKDGIPCEKICSRPCKRGG